VCPTINVQSDQAIDDLVITKQMKKGKERNFRAKESARVHGMTTEKNREKRLSHGKPRGGSGEGEANK